MTNINKKREGERAEVRIGGEKVFIKIVHLSNH